MTPTLKEWETRKTTFIKANLNKWVGQTNEHIVYMTDLEIFMQGLKAIEKFLNIIIT